MTLGITGLGLATPRYQISQRDAAELTSDFSCDSAEQRDLMSLIYRHSGVQTRGSVLLHAEAGSLAEREVFFQPRQHPLDRGPGTAARMQIYQREALPLALHAARQALSEADCAARDVTHVVVASCSGFSAPGIDIGLVQQLKLRPTTKRTLIGFMGCHGGFNAFDVASSILNADPTAVVLVCAVELCSLHHYYGWDVEKVVANALFADGAGAAICQVGSPDEQLRIVRQGSVLIDNTAEAMTWNIGDHGFEMTLSQEVPAIIERHAGDWLTNFLAQEGLTLDSVGSWAIHPGGPRILDACRKSLGLAEEKLSTCREVLAEHGNMSSATIFFVLDRLRKQPAPRPIVALGFGPGMSVEAMVID